MNSYWIDSTKNILNKFDTLEKDIETEVCIIGGGITGISTAYELSKNGIDVTVLDRSLISTHTTGRTTAKVTSQHDLFYKYLIDSFSEDIAKKYLYANESAILNIKNIINKEKIDCNFEIQDNYVFTQSTSDVQKIKEEVKAINSLGVKAEFVSTSPLPLDILGAIKLKNQAQFHPIKYVLGLCDSIIDNKGKIFSNTIVYDVKLKDNYYITYTKNNKIKSKYVVLASHYPIINVPGFYFLKMYQEKSYIIAVNIKEKLFDGMYINSELPTLSFRTFKDNNTELLLVGGSGHKVGKNENIENSYIFLEDSVKKMYPNSEVLYKWSTQDCISLDKVPYIGEFSNLMPNMYVATGFKKWGMTTSNIASNIIRDKILGKENPYEDAFTSTRFNPIKNHEETAAMLKQTSKSLILDKIKIPEGTTDDIPNDSGKVINLDGERIGVYKLNGKIYPIDPVCAHLGCELEFNNLEKTWDCPCHGSRFDYMGKVLNEPTIKGILDVDTEDIHF